MTELKQRGPVASFEQVRRSSLGSVHGPSATPPPVELGEFLGSSSSRPKPYPEQYKEPDMIVATLEFGNATEQRELETLPAPGSLICDASGENWKVAGVTCLASGITVVCSPTPPPERLHGDAGTFGILHS